MGSQCTNGAFRTVLLGIVFAVMGMSGPAHAQQAPPRPATASPAQLDRIEHKLDEVLRRLEASNGKAGQAPSPAPSGVAASVPSNPDYRPGAVAVVHAAPVKTSQLAEVPADSVGGFVYTGGPITLHDLSSRGVRYTGLTAVELQGWLKVREAGRLQLGGDLRATLGPSTVVGPECLLQAWLEDRVIGAERAPLSATSGREVRASLVLGADLQPGLYKLRLWTACLPSRETRIAAEILIKTPSELNLRGVTGDDLLHQSR